MNTSGHFVLTLITKPQHSSFIITLHGPNIKHNFQQYLYCYAWVLVTAWMCLLSRCLTMNVSSGSTIQAIKLNVTVNCCADGQYILWSHDYKNFINTYRGCGDSVVGIATGYGLDDRGIGVRVPVGSRIFSFPQRPDRLWGPPSLLSNGYRGEVHHSPPISAKVKKMWIYTSTAPYTFMAQWLIS
jgi:hypothetical protein